jgi:hypothetical protein
METSTKRTLGELMIPLWDVGARPVRKERRRDPGALDRHVEAVTGQTPRGFVDKRSTRPEPVPEQLAKLWLDVEDPGADSAHHELGSRAA